MKRSTVFIVAGMVLLAVFAFSQANAQMGNGMGTTTVGNYGGFGMMNGMAGTPMIGSDGTAYVVRQQPFQTGTPSSDSFVTELIAIASGGQKNTLKMKGLMSRPLLTEDGKYLIATTSLPDMAYFNTSGQTDTGKNASVLYAVTLPLTSASTPVSVTLEGSYASFPAFANNRIYVVTTDYGDYMMGGNMFYGMFNADYNFHNQTGKSYLYIIKLDGTIEQKVDISN